MTSMMPIQLPKCRLIPIKSLYCRLCKPKKLRMLDNYDKSILIFHYYYVNINIHINNNFTCKNLHNNIISCVTSVNIKSDKNNINLLVISDFMFTFVNAKNHPIYTVI